MIPVKCSVEPDPGEAILALSGLALNQDISPAMSLTLSGTMGPTAMAMSELMPMLTGRQIVNGGHRVSFL